MYKKLTPNSCSLGSSKLLFYGINDNKNIAYITVLVISKPTIFAFFPSMIASSSSKFTAETSSKIKVNFSHPFQRPWSALRASSLEGQLRRENFVVKYLIVLTQKLEKYW